MDGQNPEVGADVPVVINNLESLGPDYGTELTGWRSRANCHCGKNREPKGLHSPIRTLQPIQPHDQVLLV
jgi:hypothetical protein